MKYTNIGLHIDENGKLITKLVRFKNSIGDYNELWMQKLIENHECIDVFLAKVFLPNSNSFISSDLFSVANILFVIFTDSFHHESGLCNLKRVGLGCASR